MQVAKLFNSTRNFVQTRVDDQLDNAKRKSISDNARDSIDSTWQISGSIGLIFFFFIGLGGVSIFNLLPDKIKLFLLMTVFVAPPLKAALKTALFKPKSFAYSYFGLYIPIAVVAFLIFFQDLTSLFILPNWLEIPFIISLFITLLIAGYVVWYVLAFITSPIIFLKILRIKIIALARYRQLNPFVSTLYLIGITLVLFGYSQLIQQLGYFQYLLK